MATRRGTEMGRQLRLFARLRARSRSRVGRGLLGIVGGSGLAQLLAFAALPALARLFSPEETAHYALLVGIGATLASIAGLRLELAIPIPEERGSRQLFWMASVAPALVLPIVTALGIALLTFAHIQGPRFDWIDVVSIWAFVTVLVVYTAASQLAIRNRCYGLLGRIPAAQMLATLTGQVTLGLIGVGQGLFLGAVFGRSFGILGLTRGSEVRWSDRPAAPEARALLRQFWRFPVVFAPAALINNLGLYLPALMLPALFGLASAGLWAMAFRIAVAPSTILIQSTGQVFLGEFARTSGRSSSLRVFRRWSGVLLGLGVATAGGIWLLAPLVPWVLGGSWEGTEVLLRYAGVMAGAAIIGSPVQAVWTIRQWGFAQFAWNVLRLLGSASAILVGAEQGQPIEATVRTLALITCVTYALAWLGCFWAAASPLATAPGDGPSR